MKTNLPKKRLGFSKAIKEDFAEKNLQKSTISTPLYNVFNSIVTGIFKHFNNRRFTFGDGARLYLLFLSSLFLSTNNHQSNHPKIEANLLGVYSVLADEEVEPVPLAVINPLPSTFETELDFFRPVLETESESELVETSVVVTESEPELPEKIELASFQPINSANQPKVTITSDNRILVEESSLAQKKDKEIVRPNYTTKAVSYIAHSTNQKEIKVEKPIVKKPRLKTEAEQYLTTVDKTKNEAVQEGKASFVLFGASWCAPCRMMKDVLRTNEPIRNHIANNFLYDHIDIESGEGRLLKLEYNVSVVPTFILFDANGIQVAKYEGAMNSHRIKEVLGIANPVDSELSVQNIQTPKTQSNDLERKEQLNAIIADVKDSYVLGKKGEK